MRRIYLVLIILWTCAACQTAAPDLIPTASPSPRPALLLLPTLTPRLIAAATLAPTSTPVPTLALAPSATAIPASDTPNPFEITLMATHLPPLDPALLTQVAQAAPDETVIGLSAEGRPLTERRFGSGARVLMLVGGIHGGWEANTVTLMQQLIDHFTSTPQDVLPGMSIIIVPVANPDGLAYGRIPRGRFNGDDVDLNRNWSCDWSRDAFWRQERVNPGIGSFTEPETVALANFILQVRPAALFFYHSAADGVFAGNCGGDHGSAALAAVLGKAAGYPYDKPFTAYAVTGVASDWADGQGIPSADVELQSQTDSEYDRNLRGIMAVQQWLAGH